LINVPNTITCLNLISGCIATYWALSGRWELALLFIVVGAVFDFFDGMTARLLHVSSPIGKELDSLADDITFGFAPSAIIFSFLKNSLSLGEGWGEAFPYIAFIMAAFSALRLAKFNLDERQAMGFIGLPTPANALFWASLLVGGGAWLQSSPYLVGAVVAGMLFSCWLLVSEVPMFALKFKHWGWKGNEVKYIFLATSVVLLALFQLIGIAIVIAWYVVLSILTNFKKT
jgi:CDP-diacylglycerol--serine O-phosphatidyltransferase